MNATARIAAAVAGGYLLGRTRKLKLAITVGSMLAGQRISTNPRELLRQGAQLIETNPELAKLSEQVRTQLLQALRAAAVSTASDGMNSLSDAIHTRAERFSLPQGEAEEPEEDEEPEAAEEEEEPEAEEEEPEPEAEEEEEPRPRKRPAKRSSRPATKSSAKKAPANKSTANKSTAKKAAKQAPTKKSAKKAPAKKSAKKAPAKKSTAKKQAGKKSSTSRSSRTRRG